MTPPNNIPGTPMATISSAAAAPEPQQISCPLHSSSSPPAYPKTPPNVAPTASPISSHGRPHPPGRRRRSVARLLPRHMPTPRGRIDSFGYHFHGDLIAIEDSLFDFLDLQSDRPQSRPAPGGVFAVARLQIVSLELRVVGDTHENRISLGAGCAFCVSIWRHRNGNIADSGAAKHVVYLQRDVLHAHVACSSLVDLYNHVRPQVHGRHSARNHTSYLPRDHEIAIKQWVEVPCPGIPL
jgi:hypothetical protein